MHRLHNLLGLLEVLQTTVWRKNASSGCMQAAVVVERLVERVSDTDAEVRSALKDLLRDVVLPQLGAAALAPFTPLIMAHITSAMTHLADAVR